MVHLSKAVKHLIFFFFKFSWAKLGVYKLQYYLHLSWFANFYTIPQEIIDGSLASFQQQKRKIFKPSLDI